MKKKNNKIIFRTLAVLVMVLAIAGAVSLLKDGVVLAYGRDTYGLGRLTGEKRMKPMVSDINRIVRPDPAIVEQEAQADAQVQGLPGFADEWKGLKVAWYGDSLTELYYHCDIVNNYFGFEGYNCGVRGSSVSLLGENALCEESRMTREGKAIPDDADVIFIMAGTNDWAGNVALGDKKLNFDADGNLRVDTATFYGACQKMFDTLTRKYPDAYILVMGAPFGSANTLNVYNEQGLTTLDYGNALCEIASMWGIPSFNIGEMMGVNVNNVSDEKGLMYEGIHFVEGGARMAADVIIQEISGRRFYK